MLLYSNVCSRGYKWAREGARVTSLWLYACVCVREASAGGSENVRMPLQGVRLPSFIAQGERVYRERKDGRRSGDS